MPDQPSNTSPLREARTQALILLQLLRPASERPQTRAALQLELRDIDPDAIEVALAHLRAHGVAVIHGERIAPSTCARHIDALGVIAI
ncbi:MAG TPA: hypothetical protein VNV42_04435 [Solirubrobacteraceae bacterium]|jgi:hypothetical protein|nr:hypothetical protein [Solirubrobacteraceae bacterium]